MAEENKGPAKITPARVKEAAVVRNVWHATLEQGTAWERVLEPSYWAHVARKIRPGDIIEVVEEGLAFIGKLMVKSTGNVEVGVIALEYIDLREAPQSKDAASEAFEVGWKGPHLKWIVMRRSDKAVVSTGHLTREDAELAALNTPKRAA